MEEQPQKAGEQRDRRDQQRADRARDPRAVHGISTCSHTNRHKSFIFVGLEPLLHFEDRIYD
jgi:hypothetical protein